uniref:Receptor-type protein kinase n=1 Tax=Ananas comosus var. bracteatus TaxID=296719 RepID=A0A6V7QI96_ANACO|nr:unnamed protein product [Ananas comosus var. bracteatus]
MQLLLADLKMITRLPSADVLANLKLLQTLRLSDCWALTSLDGIRSLRRLGNLLLIGCPCLDTETAVLPSSLRSILFESCADVDVILAYANLQHLSRLTITRCRTALSRISHSAELLKSAEVAYAQRHPCRRQLRTCSVMWKKGI